MKRGHLQVRKSEDYCYTPNNLKDDEEYEKIVNMQKKGRKSFDIRMFRQIPAKMSLQSQCLCGFPAGTVEMKKARLGR